MDARAATWPQPAKVVYVALKWGLAALGAWVLVFVWFQNVITQRILTR